MHAGGADPLEVADAEAEVAVVSANAADVDTIRADDEAVGRVPAFGEAIDFCTCVRMCVCARFFVCLYARVYWDVLRAVGC